jgi:hypothetical protein
LTGADVVDGGLVVVVVDGARVVVVEVEDVETDTAGGTTGRSTATEVDVLVVELDLLGTLVVGRLETVELGRPGLIGSLSTGIVVVRKVREALLGESGSA